MQKLYEVRKQQHNHAKTRFSNFVCGKVMTNAAVALRLHITTPPPLTDGSLAQITLLRPPTHCRAAIKKKKGK